MEKLTTHNTAEQLIKAHEKQSQKEYRDAISLYESILSKNQNEYSAYYNLGLLYEKIQENENARNIYARGIKTARLFNQKSVEADLSFTLLGLIDY